MRKKLPYMLSPCLNCPFKKDTLKGWLGKKRANEIANSDSFVCHKTVDHIQEKKGDLSKRKQCAGFMIMKKNECSAVRLTIALGLEIPVDNQKIVFDKKSDFIKHNSY